MRYFILLCAVFTTLAANAEHSLPVFFIPNSGQADPSLRYIVQTPQLSAGFAVDSAVFQIRGTGLHVRFAGANPSVAMHGLDALAARVNFLIGDDPAAWHTGLPAYRGVVYRNLYPGIDMTYAGSESRLKSEFLVAPGADPNQIRLQYPGAERVFIDAQGGLVVQTGAAELREN